MSESDPDSRQLSVVPPDRVSVRVPDGVVVPAMIADAGERAAKRFLEFFAATIRNRNTRMAYYRGFWCNLRRDHRGPLGVAVFVTPPTPRSIRRARFCL